jgi:hypothetical protein
VILQRNLLPPFLVHNGPQLTGNAARFCPPSTVAQFDGQRLATCRFLWCKQRNHDCTSTAAPFTLSRPQEMRGVLSPRAPDPLTRKHATPRRDANHKQILTKHLTVLTPSEQLTTSTTPHEHSAHAPDDTNLDSPEQVP